MTEHICSDLHINHRNILKYCPARRLGRDFPIAVNPNDKDEAKHVEDQINLLVNDMNEFIISKWNSTVEPNDVTWIIGDVAMGLITKAPDLIRRLNGQKNLILGNHDKTLFRNIRNGVSDFQGLFHIIENYYELSHAVDGGKKRMICLSHFPMSHWNSMNQGTMMIHGHLHGNPSGLTGRIKDVGIDTNDLTPYKLDDVVRDLLAIELIRDHHDND